MESVLLEALRLEHKPVALLWTDEKPEGALEFSPGRFSCLMYHLVAAAKGRCAVIGRDSFACPGGGVGMGFGNRYEDFPGGCACFYRFLADGNANDPVGSQIGAAMAASGAGQMAEDFLHGEKYLKDEDASRRFVEAMPIIDIPAPYVVLCPLDRSHLESEMLRSITLFVTADQLSALVVLANHEHPERENVAIPFAAGCQIVGAFMYRELQREHPRALVGLTDISARMNVRRSLGNQYLSFTLAPAMFLEMEANGPSSFLFGHFWATLTGKED